MTIENTVSIDFLSTFPYSIGVFDCRLPGVIREPTFARRFSQEEKICIFRIHWLSH